MGNFPALFMGMTYCVKSYDEKKDKPWSFSKNAVNRFMDGEAISAMHPMRMYFSYILVIFCMFMTCLILVFPSDALSSGVRGVAIWWDVLFPALFPFFVISEMLLGFGIVHFFGTLLDPMMRPLFRVPGIGGFVMAMGFASGYPIGAKLTSQLWEQRLVNREEGERLVAFTSTSDPVFLIGAVSVGFFHDVSLAAILAVSHYGAGIIVGLIMRFHGDRDSVSPNAEKAGGNIWYRAFRAMHKARIEDGRTIGQLMRQAIQSSLRLILVVGGLVVFFSVVLELLTLSHVMNFFYLLINSILSFFDIPPQLSEAIVNGLFEVTLGAQSAGSAGAHISLIHKVAIAAFVLSWSGLSVHAQIVSLLTHTNLRYRPFLIARILHGLLAAIIVWLIWDPMQPLREKTAAVLPVFSPTTDPFAFYSWLLPLSAIVFFSVLTFIPLLYVGYILLKRLLIVLFSFR